MAEETLQQKADRLGVTPQSESLLKKAQRLNMQPAITAPTPERIRLSESGEPEEVESRSFLDRARDFAGGAIHSISAPGRTIQNLLATGAEKATGIEDFGRPSEEAFEESTGVDLETTSANIGEFAGEVATFAIPAGLASKITRGANILTKIGSQSLSDATIQSLNQGSLNKNTIDAAILGAAFPAGGALFANVREKMAPRVVNSLIKPLLKDFSYGKNPGQAVAQEGIIANSLDDLTQKIRGVRQSLGEEISNRVSGNTNTFSVEDAFKPVDDAISDAQRAPRTNQTIINRLQNLKDDIFGVAIVNGREIATRQLEDLSAQQVFDLKREVGDLTRWTGNATDDELVNKALKQTYGRLKGMLDDSIEGIKDMNEKYANLKSAEIATEYRDKIAARQGLISLTGTETGIGAGIVTAIATGGITIPLLVGAGAAGLTNAAKTPAVKTRIASWLAQASKSELDSAFKQAPWLRATLQSILFSEDTDEESGN